MPRLLPLAAIAFVLILASIPAHAIPFRELPLTPAPAFSIDGSGLPRLSLDGSGAPGLLGINGSGQPLRDFLLGINGSGWPGLGSGRPLLGINGSGRPVPGLNNRGLDLPNLLLGLTGSGLPLRGLVRSTRAGPDTGWSAANPRVAGPVMQLEAAVAVPEPGTLALLAAGLLGLALTTKRDPRGLGAVSRKECS